METINSLNLLNYTPQPHAERNARGCCFMIASERTAGYIPSYDSFVGTPEPLSQDKAFERLVQEQLASPENTYTLTVDEKRIESSVSKETEDRFDVFDFLDMINPLQHIPVLNYAYRYLTGDSIKPISSIIGGAVFGGAVGAASGLVTAVVEESAGKPLPNAVMSMASSTKTASGINAYEERLAFANQRLVNNANYDYNT